MKPSETYGNTNLRRKKVVLFIYVGLFFSWENTCKYVHMSLCHHVHIFRCVCVCVLPFQLDTVEVSIRLDVLRCQHLGSFSSDVEVPAQLLPLQRHAQELLTGLQTPDGQK